MLAAYICDGDRPWLLPQGEWSRLRFMQDARRHGAAAVRDLQAVLPRSAHSLYFRDEIGNISTSAVRRLRDKLDVRLQPRFPLFGGWQARGICCPRPVSCAPESSCREISRSPAPLHPRHVQQ